MIIVANLQYGWTLFVGPIDEKFQWGRAAIQIAFTIFVLAETWLMPFEGYLADRFGPRPMVMAGGVLIGVSWLLNASADSLVLLYISAAAGGAGAGAVYSACIGNVLKWFPGRRGLAAGLTAAGFGMGSAATVLPIHATIQAYGYETAFLCFGLGQGVIVFAASLMLVAPSPDEPAGAAGVMQGARNFRPLEMLRTPVFWVMYFMFVLMAAGGLLAASQLAPIAKDFKVANVPVSVLGLTLPALSFALAIDRVFNGLAKPFFGWVSDHIGRENTMFIAFGIEALAIIALAQYGQDPVLFVLLTGLMFFAWGEIYSLFPATCADSFGTQYAATNAGLLYTARGTAALLVPFAGILSPPAGSWHTVFYLAAGMHAVACVMALLVLKPMRVRLHAGRCPR